MQTFLRYSLLFLWLVSIKTFAQSIPVDNNIYQIYGMVVSKKNNDPVQYAAVRLNSTSKGAVSNEDGYYSIPVSIDDTLTLTHVGYYSNRFLIKDYLRQYKGDLNKNIVYVVHYMSENANEIDTVRIFPYDNYDEMKMAVLNMEVAHGTPEEIARENLDPALLQAIMNHLEKDESERQGNATRMYQNYYKNHNLAPTAGVDMVAAVKLLQSIVSEVKKHRNKDLNYWEEN